MKLRKLRCRAAQLVRDTRWTLAKQLVTVKLQMIIGEAACRPGIVVIKGFHAWWEAYSICELVPQLCLEHRLTFL